MEPVHAERSGRYGTLDRCTVRYIAGIDTVSFADVAGENSRHGDDPVTVANGHRFPVEQPLLRPGSPFLLPPIESVNGRDDGAAHGTRHTCKRRRANPMKVNDVERSPQRGLNGTQQRVRGRVQMLRVDARTKGQRHTPVGRAVWGLFVLRQRGRHLRRRPKAVPAVDPHLVTPPHKPRGNFLDVGLDAAVTGRNSLLPDHGDFKLFRYAHSSIVPQAAEMALS